MRLSTLLALALTACIGGPPPGEPESVPEVPEVPETVPEVPETVPEVPPTVAAIPAPADRPANPRPKYDAPRGEALQTRDAGDWVERASAVRSSEGEAGGGLGLIGGGSGAGLDMSGSVDGLGAGRGMSGYGRGGGGSAEARGLGIGTIGGGASGAAPPPSPDVVAVEGVMGRKDRPPVRQVSTEPLRAGRTNDNADFSAFLEFVGTWTDQAGMAGQYQQLDVSGRAYVTVVDRAGVPVPDVELTLSAGAEVVHRARTYGDGRAPLYPSLASDRPMPAGGWTLRIDSADGAEVRPWFGEELTLVRRAGTTSEVVPLDVAFLLDTTGSMGDEIEQIKQSLLAVTERVRGLERKVDLRFGAVLYRDLEDDYVTRRHRFTPDVQAFDRALRDVQAGGGGDTPESLNQGLAEVVHGLDWRADAARVVFLVADAPPHMDYEQDLPYGDGAVDALGLGIRVHTVAASGLDPVGSLVFRQIAQLTQGEFIFIEYGSVADSARSHGIANAEQLQGNNLDQILYDRLRAEVDGWRR
jgi:hypothetical protein